MAIIEHARYYESTMYNANHVHTDCELIYVVSGSLSVSDGNTEYRIGPKDAVLIKSRCRHAVTVPFESDYKRYLAFINPWELKKRLVQPDLFALLTDTSESGMIIVRDDQRLEQMFKLMAEIFENNNNIYSELGAVLGALAEFIRMDFGSDPKPLRSGKRLAETVREYIEDKYTDNIRISDIAALNYVSPSYLTHIFKSETGLSPKEYLSHIRCTRAYELIMHTNMKFSYISEITGFSCANDMSRKIREYYGMTPTEIRFGRQ